jgi:hypothetical protein
MYAYNWPQPFQLSLIVMVGFYNDNWYDGCAGLRGVFR